MQPYYPPLRERVLVSRSGYTSSEVGYHQKNPHQTHYKVWTHISMEQAMKAVIQDGMSIRKAACVYGVPKSTLGDRISGKVLPGTKSGPPSYLTEKEEQELVTFLTRSSAIGYGRTRKEVIAIVERLLCSHGIHKYVTNGWWESFSKRHPELVLRTASTLSISRAKASDWEIVNNYFDILEDTLEQNDLLSHPCQIFNIDESGMPYDPKPLKTIHKRGIKNPSHISSGSKGQVTIVGCVSAGGQCLPPMIIWDRKTLSPDLTIGEIPGTVYGLSSKGWIDQELFHLWFTQHFIKYAPTSRPLLLLMDGHSSHYCPETIRYALKEKVILFTFPPNTTHLTQPLDKGVFGPLKLAWRDVCHKFIVKNPGVVVNRYNFSVLFSEAWVQAMTPRNILSGFRTTGIFPFNRDSIKLPTDPALSLSIETGISYIPLYTPVKRRISTSKVIESPVYSEEETVESHLDWSDISDNEQVIAKKSVSPPSESTIDSYQPSLWQSSFQQLIKCPIPPPPTVIEQKHSCRILTSSENLQQIEAKEKEKQEKLRIKAERARKRAQSNLLKSKKCSKTGKLYVHSFS